MINSNIDNDTNDKIIYDFHPSSTQEIYKIQTSPKTKCLLKDLCYDWFNYRRQLCLEGKNGAKSLSSKTIDGNHTIVFKVLLPYFQNNKILYLSQLNEHEIQKLISSIKSQNTKHKSYLCLNMIFKYAIKNNLTTTNPLSNITKPPESIQKYSIDDQAKRIIYISETDKWLDCFEKHPHDTGLLFEAMLLCGLRPEEACGLKWTSVTERFLRIENAYKSVNIYNSEHKIIGHNKKDDRLKTAQAYRKIVIPPRLKNNLLEHKQSQIALFKSKNKKWNENQYVFLNRFLEPYVPDSLAGILREIVKKNHLKRITPYDLRKSYASACATNKLDRIYIMSQMGHTDINLTYKHYIQTDDDALFESTIKAFGYEKDAYN